MLQPIKNWLESRELRQIKGHLSTDELNERFAKALVSGKRRVAAYLLDLGASPNQNIVKTKFMSADVVQHTPMTWAIETQNEVLLKQLLDKGADVMKPLLYIPAAGPVRERLPLVMAVETKAVDCVLMLAPRCTVDCLMTARDRVRYSLFGSATPIVFEYFTCEIFKKQSQQVSQQAAMAASVRASGALAGTFNTAPLDRLNGATLTGDCIETTTPTKKFRKMQIQKR